MQPIYTATDPDNALAAFVYRVDGPLPYRIDLADADGFMGSDHAPDAIEACLIADILTGDHLRNPANYRGIYRPGRLVALSSERTV